MTRILTSEHKRKLVEGRKKFMASRVGLVCKIADGLFILADEDNYIVRHGKRDAYLPSLEMALGEAQQVLEKQNLLTSKQKELSLIIKSVMLARQALYSRLHELVK